MNRSPPSHPGKVYLVGAGPGDPRLITLRAVECLARADLVLHDCLVNPALLDKVSPSAEVVHVRRRGRERSPEGMSQQQINDLLISSARQGKTVVYLKGGDPVLFSHGAEEAEALATAGVPREIVPGVTAASAAAAYADIPITHPQHSSAVALVTAQQPSGSTGPPPDFGALAAFPGTLVFYMGSATAEDWSRTLIRHGKPPQTPVAIVRRCTWPDQETIRCTLGALAEVIAAREVRPPTVIIVGQVAASAPEVSWFAARPLFGRRILLTRPRDQVGPLQEKLGELGAEVMIQPAIEIGDPADWGPVDAALARLDQYDWLVFSSVNGVRYLLQRLFHNHGDSRRLGGTKLAAIGPATAEELLRYGLRADFTPPKYRAESLADGLAADASGKRFLLARASRGREVLAERLCAAGGRVDQVVVYSSTGVERPDKEVDAALSAGRIDWITVTSSAIARALHAMFAARLGNSKLASISPITSDTLRQLGHEPSAEAEEYTTDGLVDAILDHG